VFVQVSIFGVSICFGLAVVLDSVCFGLYLLWSVFVPRTLEISIKKRFEQDLMVPFKKATTSPAIKS